MKKFFGFMIIVLSLCALSSQLRAQDTTLGIKSSLDMLKEAAKAAAKENKENAVKAAGDLIQQKSKDLQGATDSVAKSLDQPPAPETAKVDKTNVAPASDTTTTVTKQPAAKKKSTKKVKAPKKKTVQTGKH